MAGHLVSILTFILSYLVLEKNQPTRHNVYMSEQGMALLCWRHFRTGTFPAEWIGVHFVSFLYVKSKDSIYVIPVTPMTSERCILIYKIGLTQIEKKNQVQKKK